MTASSVFYNAIPVLPALDISKSIIFYEKRLNFPEPVSCNSLKRTDTLLAVTNSAINGSSTNQPVSLTRKMPITTPTEVQTSFNKWWASALRAMERNCRPAFSRI